jgi:septal ring factor EnvC (AmiA/AmiB activator)
MESYQIMKKLIISLFLIVMLFPLSTYAEEKSLQDQFDEIKIMIEREQIRNIELKAELAKNEQEAEELKRKLQDIEDEIDALKAKHNLN